MKGRHPKTFTQAAGQMIFDQPPEPKDANRSQSYRVADGREAPKRRVGQRRQ